MVKCPQPRAGPLHASRADSTTQFIREEEANKPWTREPELSIGLFLALCPLVLCLANVRIFLTSVSNAFHPNLTLHCH